MRAVFSLTVVLLISVYVESQSPVFLVDPISVAALDGTTVEFSCTAENVTSLFYLVNGEDVSLSTIQDKGFAQDINLELLGGTIRRRNLTVIVSSLYNNTEIRCQATGNSMLVNSDTAILSVQGPLSSVGDLSSSFINSSTVNISWSPPFTLPGTAITGYNLSVTSNVTTANYFTSDSYYVLDLSNVTDSPCNEINITVSGYNGLNGETDSISVPSSDVVVPLSVDVSEALRLTVNINVSNICVDEHPTTINITLFRDNTKVDVVVSDYPKSDVHVLTVDNNRSAIVEDQTYTVKASFSIFGGEFDVKSRHVFNTFGVRSVNLTDTDIDSVSCICTFSSFSTDTGCTVQLLLSDIVQYEQNLSRSGDTATGSISGVATGLYLVHVFDQGNPTVVLTSELMVIGEPDTTTTTTFVTSSMATITPTVPVMSTAIDVSIPVASSDSQSTTLYIAIGVPTGAVIIIILAVVLTLVVCVVWQKNNSKGNKLESSDVEEKQSESTVKDKWSPQDHSLPIDEQKEIKDTTDHDSKPCRQRSNSPKLLVYANLSEIAIKDRPFPAKADNIVVYSDPIIKGQPPPPPYEPVVPKLKQLSNIQASVTVIPVGTKVDESEFHNEIVELIFPHMDNYQEAVESRANNYPPPPEGRAPSPPNEGNDQPPPIPSRHLPDVVQNNQCSADKEESFTDKSKYPELGEITSDKGTL